MGQIRKNAKRREIDNCAILGLGIGDCTFAGSLALHRFSRTEAHHQNSSRVT